MVAAQKEIRFSVRILKDVQTNGGDNAGISLNLFRIIFLIRTCPDAINAGAYFGEELFGVFVNL